MGIIVASAENVMTVSATNANEATESSGGTDPRASRMQIRSLHSLNLSFRVMHQYRSQ